MKSKIKIILLELMLMLVAAVMCQATYVVPRLERTYNYMTMTGQSLFNGNELSIDIGPQYTTPQGETVFQPGGGKGVWGINGALTYWIKPEFGIGTSAGIIDTREQNSLVVDHWDFVTINGRLPLFLIGGKSLYVFRHFAIVGDISPLGKDFRNGNYRIPWNAGIVWRLSQHVGFSATYGQTYEAGTFRVENDNIKTSLEFSF